MILGESDDFHESRVAREELMAADWVAQNLDPTTAKLLGGIIKDIILVDLEAHDEAGEALTNAMFRMQHPQLFEEPPDVLQDQITGGMNAYQAYTSRNTSNASTGYPTIDKLHGLQEQVLASASDPDFGIQYMAILESARSAAARIRHENRPGPLAY